MHDCYRPPVTPLQSSVGCKWFFDAVPIEQEDCLAVGWSTFLNPVYCFFILGLSQGPFGNYLFFSVYVLIFFRVLKQIQVNVIAVVLHRGMERQCFGCGKNTAKAK